jgi:thioredoxin 1
MQQLIEPDALEDGEYPYGALRLTDENLKGVVGSYGTVVVDLWAPWCGPCRTMSPVIDNVADEMQGEVVFGKLNTDDNRETMSEFMVQSIPTLLLFKDGKFKDRIVGAVDKKTIIRKVQSLL